MNEGYPLRPVASAKTRHTRTAERYRQGGCRRTVVENGHHRADDLVPQERLGLAACTRCHSSARRSSSGAARVRPDQVRYGLIIWETLQLLRDSRRPLSRAELVDAVRVRLQPTAFEDGRNSNGRIRWVVALNFQTGDATTIGWMTKRDGGMSISSGSRLCNR